MIKVGLEVHVHPSTSSKLFCRCPTSVPSFCEICLAHPGAKPMAPNKQAILKTITLAKALSCRIVPKVFFLRKHYFYPDLPAGFQRTSMPIGVQGQLAGVRIREIHLEEDAGRYDPRKGTVDYSRAGMPLIEVVTEPDIHSSKHAERFLKEFKDVLDYFSIWSDKILRADVNISADGGEKVEIKEISTIRGVRKAIEYEAQLFKSALPEKMITKHYDEKEEITLPSREKESALEYRYIPDPDIPPLDVSSLISLVNVSSVFRVKEEMQREKVPAAMTRAILVAGLAEFYSQLVKRMHPVLAARWISSVLIGEMRKAGITSRDLRLDPERVARILTAQRKGEISKLQAIRAVRKLLRGEKTETERVITEEDKVLKIVAKVLEEEPDAVKKYLSGKEGVLHYLIGRVVRKSEGRITHEQAKQAISRLLLEH